MQKMQRKIINQANLPAAAILCALLLTAGCGERKNAVVSGQLYQITSTLPPIGVFHHLCISQGTGYLAADYMGIIVLDLQEPSSPVVVDTLNNYLLGAVLATEVHNESGYIYVEAGFGANWPQALWQFPLDEIDGYLGPPKFFTGSPPMEEFTVVEFTRDSSGVILLDSLRIYIDDTSETPSFQQQFAYKIGGVFQVLDSNGYGTTVIKIYDFAINNNLAYLAADEYGMLVVDLNNGVTEVGSFDTEGFCRGISYQDGYCYLADRHWGLQVIDVSVPAHPVQVANLKFTGADDCIKVKVLGGRAVVLDQYDGVFALDISDPLHPKLLFNFDTITPIDVVLTENYIYVVDEDAGLVTARW